MLKQHNLLEGLAHEPEIPNELYKFLGRYTNSQLRYRLSGRDGRDVRLEGAPFVLGADGRLHPPSRVIAVVGVHAGEGVPSFLTRFVERFETRGAERGKVPLHPTVGADPEALSQLQRCGLETLDPGSLRDEVRNFVFGTGARKDFEGMGRLYPDDAVEGAHYLVAQGETGYGAPRIISAESILKDAGYLFVPDAPLDWSKVAQDGYLPAYSAVHPFYLDADRLARWGISRERMLQFLQESGLHGFDPEKDRPLREDASYAIVEARLREKGHRPQRVQHRRLLGYDIECSQHCSGVFEVKSMGEPSDVELEPSETLAARERADDYYLVCVYGLPGDVGYKKVRDPGRIWEPIERARVTRERWWTA